MNEITLTFTPEELRELAKQLYLASYFYIGTGYDYNENVMLKEITTRICATGFLEANETGEFTHGGPTEIPFTLTNDATEECELMVELYEGYAVKEYLPYALADRDFADKYGHMEVEEIVNNGKLLQELEAIQEKYKEEFEKYGVTHLRLQQ